MGIQDIQLTLTKDDLVAEPTVRLWSLVLCQGDKATGFASLHNVYLIRLLERTDVIWAAFSVTF